MHKVREIRPIEYFLPIIDGWLAFDKYINSKSSETGKESSIGQTLAGIYFLDMATEHFQRFGKRSELENVFSEHPGFSAFINMKENAVSKKQYNEHLMLLNHPGIFTLKNYGIGFFESALWTLKDFWVIQSIREKKKYPIQNSPLRGNL